MRTNIKNGKPVLFAHVFLLLTSQISDDSTVLRLTAKLQLGFLVTVPSFRGLQV